MGSPPALVDQRANIEELPTRSIQFAIETNLILLPGARRQQDHNFTIANKIRLPAAARPRS
jgi:hypothetical protein